MIYWQYVFNVLHCGIQHFIGFYIKVVLLVLLLAGCSLSVPDSKAPQKQQQQQSKQIVSSHFYASSTANQVVDAYKDGLQLKYYIAASLKNRESPEYTIIKNQLSSGNTICDGSDTVTKPT